MSHSLQRILSRACDIEANEVRATLASFSLVLILMGSYYILRPVRDAMASDWTDAAKASGLTDYPETTLVKLATTKLVESGDPFANLVANFEWTNDDQNGVALDIESGMSPEEAARKWIDANPDKVAAWTGQM